MSTWYLHYWPSSYVLDSPRQNSEISTSSVQSLAPEPPLKRGPGRPKGSGNKAPRAQTEEPSVPKPRGRPRGSGPKQIARAQGIIEPEQPKRPVGRPPKLPPPQTLSIRVGNEVCIDIKVP